jgi:predicted TIM-barrel fold metal-dependent hydrolase
MPSPLQAAGFVDCDVHLTVPDTATLVPYLEDYWREHVLRRGIDGDNLEASAYPPFAPINCRPDWKPAKGLPASRFEQLRDHVLAPFNPRFAICNVLHGAQIMFSEDLSGALCRAVNNWIAAEFLDRDPRLRASITVPVHSPEQAVAEIEHRAADTRFVQVLMFSLTELPLGRRQHWPIYAAAERHGLPVGIHAGSSFRHPPSALGWLSYYIEDYVSQAPGFAVR